MLVKTFQARDMAAALRMVKAEMGADALILSSKAERRKGIMGILSKPMVEVTAAYDPRPAQGATHRGRQEEVELNTRQEFQNSMLAPIARELKELRQKVDTLAKRDVESLLPAATPDYMADHAVSYIPRVDPGKMILEDDVTEFSRLLVDAIEAKQKELATSAATSAAAQMAAAVELPDASTSAGQAPSVVTGMLRDAGLTADSVELVSGELLPLLEARGDGEVEAPLAEALTRLVRCSGPLQPMKDRTRVLAFVGPSGVGKTTVLLKMAAALAKRKGTSIALLSADRTGLMERYPDVNSLQGVALQKVTGPKEMQAAIAAHGDKGFILVDTTGICHRDVGKLKGLKSLLASIPDAEVHLCLAATTRDRELGETMAGFAMLPIKGLVFTRLDECATYGCVVNAHLSSGLPLTYFSRGDRIADGLHPAKGGWLAARMLECSAAVGQNE